MQHDKLNDIAQRASKFTGRKLTWSFETWEEIPVFCLGDKSGLGDLALCLVPGCTMLVREVYMRTRHFGLDVLDQVEIAKALSERPAIKPEEPIKMVDPLKLDEEENYY